MHSGAYLLLCSTMYSITGDVNKGKNIIMIDDVGDNSCRTNEWLHGDMSECGRPLDVCRAIYIILR